MHLLRTMMLAVALTATPTAALVLTTAVPAVAEDGMNHSDVSCYEYDNVEWSNTQHYGSAHYVTEHLSHWYECYDPSSGTYTFWRMYDWATSYWVYDD